MLIVYRNQWESFQNQSNPFNSLINRLKLAALLGIKDNDPLSEYHRNWVDEVLKNGSNQRDAKWTESIGACPVNPGCFI